MAAIGAYVLAMLLWFRKHSLGFERHLLYAPHCELGAGETEGLSGGADSLDYY